MISAKDKAIMKPSLLAAKQALLEEHPKLDGVELVEAVCDADMPVIYGKMERATYLYLCSNYPSPSTQKWLFKLLVEGKDG